MLFRSWLAVEKVNYTEFLYGNFDNYQVQIQQNLLPDSVFYHILCADYYTQLADFEQAESHLLALTSAHKTDTEQAEYVLSQLFYQNRTGQIHAAGNTFEANKKHARAHPSPDFWLTYQALGANVYFRKGKVEKAYKLLKKLLKKPIQNSVLEILIYVALSEYVLYLGELKQAEIFFETAKRIYAQSPTTNYSLFLPVFHRHQALLARYRYDLPKAHQYLENALRLNLNLYGKQHGDVASAYCEKAVLALQEGNYEAMNRYNLDSEKIRSYLYPNNQIELAQNEAFKAIYAGMRGDSATAVTLYERAYWMLKKSTWTQNPNLLGLEFSRTVFEAEQGDSAQALQKMSQILTETQKVRGKNFTELAPAHVFMAQAYMAMGDYSAAQKSLAEAFRICGETLGEHNIIYADCLKSCGKLYILEAKYAKAERTFIHALNLLSALHQRHTVRFTVVLQALSELYREVGETPKSIDYLEQCIHILEQLSHTNPLQILGLYLSLCEAYAEQKSPRAELYFEKLAQFGKDLPHDHPAHISILKTAIYVKLHRKKYQEALNYAETISQLFTLKNEFDHPIYQENELQICNLLLKTNQLERCIRRTKLLLAQREAQYFQFQITLKLVQALRLHGDLEEAENICRSYLNRNAQFQDLTDYYTELALIYAQSNRYILSKKYFEEAITNLNRIVGANSYRHLAIWESYQKLAKTLKDKVLEDYITEKLIEIRANHLN